MSFIDPRVQFPYRGKTGSTKEPVLLRNEISESLDKFAAANEGRQIFVIQGGNRYMSCYLSLKHGIEVRSIKLLDIAKVKLAVFLNTLLLPDERASTISARQQKKINFAYCRLSASKKKQIRIILSSLGFTDIQAFLGKATISMALKLFGDFQLNSPFSYPADDRRIKTEFAGIIPFASNMVANIEERDILRLLFMNTTFFRLITDKVSKCAYLDDVFYRGRTYYAIVVLHSLLRAPSNHWKLYTLCADRVSNDIHANQILVLKRGVLYPFENSIQTEGGYWEELDDYFLFRDTYKYCSALSHNSSAQPLVLDEWKRLIEQIRTAIHYRKLPRETVFILIELYLFFVARNKSIDVEAILDQRAKNTGYCTPFVKLISVWINQEEPRWKRQQYKDKIKDCLKRISEIASEISPTIQFAAKIYHTHSNIIDHDFLCNFYGNR